MVQWETAHFDGMADRADPRKPRHDGRLPPPSSASLVVFVVLITGLIAGILSLLPKPIAPMPPSPLSLNLHRSQARARAAAPASPAKQQCTRGVLQGMNEFNRKPAHTVAPASTGKTSRPSRSRRWRVLVPLSLGVVR